MRKTTQPTEQQLRLEKVLREKVKKSGVKWTYLIHVNFADSDWQSRENFSKITLIFNDECIKANMQEDLSAFEAWSLILWCNGITEKVYLKLDDIDVNQHSTPHINRFLFRLYWFNELFGGSNGWFELDNKTMNMLDDAKMIWQGGESNIKANKINRNKEVVFKGNTREVFIESYLAQDADSKCKLEQCIGNKLNRLGRQIPVGLYKDNKEIFVGKAGRADLWGRDESTFYAFELKCEDNKKVGIVSELFFYTMYFYELLIRKSFKLACTRSEAELQGIEKIQAYYLIENQHPLVTGSIIKKLNAALKSNNIPIVFGELKYTSSGAKEAVLSEDQSKFKIESIFLGINRKDI